MDARLNERSVLSRFFRGVCAWSPFRSLQNFTHWATIAIAIVTVWAFIDVITDGTQLRSVFGPEVGYRGECDPGQELVANEFCVFAPTQGRFRVVANGAIPPGETRLAEEMIKVDWDDSGHSFQAVRLPREDGVWKIEVAGLWNDVWDGTRLCQAGDQLTAGQFCIEPTTRERFRVYATDELNAGDRQIRQQCPTGDGDDCRQLHQAGYGVLYWFVGHSTELLTYVPNQWNGRLDARRIYCVDRVSGDVLFHAERQSTPDAETRSDRWQILQATEGVSDTLECMAEPVGAQS